MKPNYEINTRGRAHCTGLWDYLGFALGFWGFISVLFYCFLVCLAACEGVSMSLLKMHVMSSKRRPTMQCVCVLSRRTGN